MNLFRTYWKARDMFVRPKVQIYFGLWRNDPNLPVWRAGRRIQLVSSNKISSNYHNFFGDYLAYTVKNHSYIYTRTSVIDPHKEEVTTPYYKVSQHKLPKGLSNYDIVWTSNIRKKLRKYHLSWIKPVFNLPMWLSFYYTNHDVWYKSKYDELRYEFPPQFTIVLFGISLTITLHSPERGAYASDGNYWECILNYIYNKPHTIKGLIDSTGYWMGKDYSYFTLRQEYLKEKYHNQYRKIIYKIRKQKHKLIW